MVIPCHQWLQCCLVKIEDIEEDANWLRKTNAYCGYQLGYWHQVENRIQHTWMPPLHGHSGKREQCASYEVWHVEQKMRSQLTNCLQTYSSSHELGLQGNVMYCIDPQSALHKCGLQQTLSHRWLSPLWLASWNTSQWVWH